LAGATTNPDILGTQQEHRHKLVHRDAADTATKPPWSTKAFAHTVREIEHHDVVSSGIFADEFPDKHPSEWTKQAVITLEKPTEAYMVEVTAQYH
jgi:hypothetical protein